MSRPRLRSSLAVVAALCALLASVAYAQSRPRALRVVVYDADGVGRSALDSAMAAFGAAERVAARLVTPEGVRGGALDDADVVLFTGGRGSVQGRLLGDDGRARVRRFVERGGGYVGICAGSYLALQGEPEFYKVAIVAAANATGDRWQRGTRETRVQPNDGSPPLGLHFANGPLLAPRPVEGLAPFVTLATFDADVYWEEYGTLPGEMPGTPAVAVARYGRGRVLLFSPNPTLDPAHPELLVRGARWAAREGEVPASLQWADVFGGGPSARR